MKKFAILGVVALLLTLAVMPVSADGDITVTVTVTDSNNQPLQGVSIQYKKPPSTTPWPLGTTDSDGKVTKALPPGTYAFRASYAQTSSGWGAEQDISFYPTVDFQTSSITAQVRTCAEAPISGASVWYKVLPSTTPWPLGTTGSGGTVSKELFPGTYAFRADYQHTRAADITQDVGANPLVSFTTTRVTVYYSGAVHYKELSTWWPFTKPSMELFAGTIPFRFGGPGGYEVDLVVSGCDVTAYPVLVRLLDSNGNGLAGGFAEYFRDGSWNTIGTTGSDGTVFAVLPVKPWQIRMTYEWVTNRTTQDITVDSVVTFNTIDVLVTLKTCAGVGIAGGVAEYQSGYWRPIGTTDSNGEIRRQMLPSNLLFKMSYAYGADRFYQDTALDPSVDFTTTRVTLNFNGTIEYQSGYWRPFTQPTMQMMPGTYLFKFEGAGPTMRQYLTISGCEMGGYVAFIKLLDSNGNGIAGGTAEWYRTSGPAQWVSVPGSTDTNGNLFALVGLSGPKFRLTYACTRGWEQHDLLTDPNVVFRTGRVVSDSGTCTHWRSTLGGSCPVWVPFVNGVEMLPSDYEFKGYDPYWKEFWTILAGVENHIH